MQKWIPKLANLSAIGMFLILAMGALVTKADAGRGCGDEWPLCHGKFVPAHTISSFIEYSHRLVVGIVTLILIATFILVFRYVKRKDAKYFITGTVVMTLIQAVMGALAVVWPQSSLVLALHFGLSLLAFAFSLLLALVFTPWGQFQRDTAIRSGFKVIVWITAVYSYVVVYLGAFVRHTVSSGGCTGWPLCNGEVIPELSGATGIVFTHRIAALLLFVCILFLYLQAKRYYPSSDKLHFGSKWSLILVSLQVFSGAVVTWSMGNELAYLFTGMIHAVIVAGMFGFLCYLCVLTLYDRQA
ncbi:heme A synthase [Paenibacillus sp. GCM10023248]|uniref:COX15/CtaA family protein n=1 Tax=Bacillales TaxID=1385 RepID=UPI0023789400|nr:MULTISPECIES: COX15/CtaA family protein [Bacillales]MDD9271302.1 COX15/CtaA family protein [Paenibacillus sp. MAHUQ-63]MDR6881576.1 cytochrome c oxidase assembly protein subunit 15 [Bacillus sp. 3255]